MSDEDPPSRAPLQQGRWSSALAHKLSLTSRAREAIRRASDRILAADLAWSAIFVGTLLVLLLDFDQEPVPLLRAGEKASFDVTAPRDLEIVDAIATERRRQSARASSPEVYTHDVERRDRILTQIAALFQAGRDGRDRHGVVPSEEPTSLRADDYSPAIEREVTTAVRHALNELVVGNKALLSLQSQIVVRRVPGDREERLSRYETILDLRDAQRMAREHLLTGLPPTQPGREALADLAASLVDANLAFDPRATEQRRRQAALAVVPVRIRIDKGTHLVHAGEVVTPEVEAHLLEMGRTSLAQPGLISLLGLMVIVGLLAFFLYRYTRYHQRHFKKLPHLHALFILLMISLLALARAMQWVVHGVVDRLPAPFDQADLYIYLFPVGGGAILVALLANGRIAMVYSAFTALVFGMMAEWDMVRFTWVLLVQWAGVYAISAYRERSALLRAGLIVGGAGALAVLALQAMHGSLEPMGRSLYAAGLAFVGGAVGVGVLVSFTLPLLERLFNVLTDVRLLELANVNHPLLAQLAVRAPGSYNHSMVVGTLAEEAAKAIGANSLFCRVAAFYHDVGKMRKPDYYVENQRGVNPHDRLSASMSALVIAAHVKDGIRLAREAGLPEQIVDIIPQHHGTRLMSYFYEKAKRAQDPALGPVNEEDFRYPGPKPGTREAAIFMLADGVEAASRTASEPSPSKLREVIRQVTNAIVLDGQLDACDLTFSDLEKVQAAFLRTLMGTHHHRVEYPGFDFNRGRTERPAAKAPGEATEHRVARGS